MKHSKNCATTALKAIHTSYRYTLAYARSDAVFRRILKNSGWLLGSQGINAGLAFIQSILIARMLGVEQLGILGIVMTYVAVINRITSFRMNEFVVKFAGDAIAQNNKEKASLFIKSAMIIEACASIIAFGILLLLAPISAQWFVQDTQAQSLITFYGIVLLANLISETSTGVLQLFNSFQFLSMSNSVRSLVSVAIMIAAILGDGGIWGVLFAYLSGNLTAAMLMLIVTLRETAKHLGHRWWRVPVSFMQGSWRTTASFILNTNISATISLITKESDLLWLGFLRTPAEVGYYKLASSLASLAFIPISPLTQTTYPEINHKVAKKDWDGLIVLLRNISLIVLAFSATILGFVALFGTFLIGILYGADFEPAFPALMFLLVGLAISNVFYWTRPTLLSFNRVYFLVQLGVLTSILKVIGVFIFVPIWGFIGNAVLLCILYCVGVGGALWKSLNLLRQSRNEHISETREKNGISNI